MKVEDVANAITDKTALVSVMFANNEVGTIEPVAEIGALCRERKIPFHTDAVQAAAHLDIDVKAMNIDMLSMSAHKMYGPKGVGALYLRKGLRPENFVHGGAQEKGRRASTENIAGIVGFGEAMEILKGRLSEDKAINSARRDRLIAGLLERIPHAKLNGSEVTGKKTTYSVKKYCDSALKNENNSDALKGLVVDLLDYADNCQKLALALAIDAEMAL